jgi:hypothetical protein
MRKTLLSIFILLSYLTPLYLVAHDHHHDHHDHHDDHHDALTFEVHQRDYTLSTVFELISGHDYYGTIVKSIFHTRHHYDLYNVMGIYEGQGICRFLNPMSVFGPWAKEIDVWGADDSYLGLIDGDVITGAGAKYSIYNFEGERVGIAYLDYANSGFTMVHPINEQHIIAHFRREFVSGEIDHWHVKIFDRDTIDLRIIKVFSAFAVDYQEYFKEDR